MAGTIGINFVAITCIRTTHGVTAVVMVIGPDSNGAARVREDMRDRRDDPNRLMRHRRAAQAGPGPSRSLRWTPLSRP